MRINLRELIVIAQLEDQIVLQLVRPDHAEYRREFAEFQDHLGQTIDDSTTE